MASEFAEMAAYELRIPNPFSFFVNQQAIKAAMSAIEKRFRQVVDLLAERRVGDREGKQKGSEAGQDGFGVLAGIMRLVNERVRGEGADAEKGRRSPSVCQMARVLRERQSHRG